jgi:membrane protease YdiL (CAAX protease family)
MFTTIRNMVYSFDWKTTETGFIVCLLATGLGFILYYFISKSEKLKTWYISRKGLENDTVGWVMIERSLGVFFFGIVPLLIILIGSDESLTHYGLSSRNFLVSIFWTLALSPLILVMNYFNSKKPDNLAMYPQIRKKEWDTALLVQSALSWTAYLFAYEFLFRGYLLFVSLHFMGVWPAIALNIVIYSLVHVPKGHKEAFGAVPLGIVLCIVTIHTGNIWFAFLLHVVMALSNEWFSIKMHPEMKWVRIKKRTKRTV